MRKSFRNVSSIVVAGSVLLLASASASAALLEVTNASVSNDRYLFTLNTGPGLQPYGGSISAAPALVDRNEFFYRDEGTGMAKFMRVGSVSTSAYMVFGWDFSNTQYRPTEFTVSAPWNLDFADPKINWVYSWSTTGQDGSWTVISEFQANAIYDLSEVVTITGTPDRVYLKIETVPVDGRTVVGDTIQWGRGDDASGIALGMEFDLVQIPESSTFALFGGAIAAAAMLFLRRRS